MATFYYRTIKKMEPRLGQRFSTEYYKQTQTEYQRLRDHVRTTLEAAILAADKNHCLQDLETPLKGFPKSQKQPNYTAFEVMNDLLEQLQLERDLPNGMLGRWNRLFANSSWAITLIPRTE